MARRFTIMNKLRKKLRSREGFTLGEMLVCTVIMLIATALTVSTLTLGIGHFKARTRESEARVLCNSLGMAVQEQLSYATFETEEEITAPVDVAVFNSVKWPDSECSIEKQPDSADDGMLVLNYDNGKESGTYSLVSASEYTADGDLYVKDFSLQYDPNGYFAVAITVNSKSFDIQEATAHFTVAPFKK